MPETPDLNSVCLQLLHADDLKITAALFEQLRKEEIVTKIFLSAKGVSIKIYSTKVLYLSSIAPVLHDFGFLIIDEITYTLPKDKTTVHINRFNLDIHDVKKIESAKENIEEIISLALLGKHFDKCQLYSLVYLENLSLRQIQLMRALIEYLNQAVLSFNTSAIILTLNRHHHITRLFVDYFLTRFDPALKQREIKIKAISQAIDEEIKSIPNILEDKILKLTFTLLESLLRTNYFLDHEAIALKIHTELFSEHLKGIQPKLEIFVYHSEYSGMHLRMSKISRGGLRWSERHEDYRTEIKSLMITQEGKNSIIVPDGAKGGFVIRKEKSEITKEYFEQIYTAFINNLLDMVDNVINNKVVKHDNILAYDEDDTYFVVAADKGTANMSDVANSISIKRNFWLKDAFASGGSKGFGHKELGITAKGSLISSQRFFIEKGVDFYKEPISLVGIGSMNGDVFGNGLLESKAFRLLSAISHQEIFVDPDPIPITAYEERQRLFLSKDGSWSAYDRSLISKGGGVFYRADKSIELSSEIQKMVGTVRKSLSGEELAKKLLCMKVDMLFNGGVGTYVKSSDESDLDIGDKQNESVRCDANELRAFCICEGGNLGLTQRARIEYAKGGGRINIDGIDNSAGVNISDHEVNLKILLNTIQAKGLLSEEEKNKTLCSLTEQVAKLVLWDNYNQSLALSRDERLSRTYLKDFIAALRILEQNLPAFKRKDFQIPKDENIHEVINKENSIVRPVLASMLSYAKIFVKDILIKSTLIDESFALGYLYKYFPKSFVGIYEHEISQHPLKRELIATALADKVINYQGVSFISDFEQIGGEKFVNKIKSYLICNQLFGTNDIRYEVFRQDFIMPSAQQYALLFEMEHTLNFSVKWMIKYLIRDQIDANHILENKDALFVMLDKINGLKHPEIIPGNETFNSFFAHIEYLRFAVTAISIKESTHHNFNDVAALFYRIVSEFKIIELLSALDATVITLESDRVLKQQLLFFIDFIVVHYTHKVLSFQRIDENPEDAFNSFISNENEAFKVTRNQLEAFENYETIGLNEITITINQLMASAI
jgi:glutamate dehydrogenase